MNIQSTLQSMTIQEKVGQMFMLAFAADQRDAARILMAEHLVGAAYIGDENVPTAGAAIELTNTLQSYARGTRLGIPLLLGAAAERIEAAQAPGDAPPAESLLVVVGRGTSDPDANSNIAKVTRMLWEGLGFGWAETCYSGVTTPLVGPALERIAGFGLANDHGGVLHR